MTTAVKPVKAARRHAAEAPPKPRYTLIQGDFYIMYPDLPNSGPEPDGDTINFVPDSEDLVLNLPRFSGRSADHRHIGFNTRFEGIDALETHFLNRHQNLQYAEAARNRMLELMGFGDVVFNPDRPNKVLSAENHPMRGYLLANGIESNGRILGLVYSGTFKGASDDGERVFVDETMLERSVNAKLLVDGLAYAELYATMPLKLIERMRQIVKAAREGRKGFWPKESIGMTKSASLDDLADLPELILFPKLYRRLVKYFEDGYQGLTNFDTWIRADHVKRDDKALLPNGEIGNLHDLYDVSQGALRLNYQPEDLTFEPDPPNA